MKLGAMRSTADVLRSAIVKILVMLTSFCLSSNIRQATYNSVNDNDRLKTITTINIDEFCGN
jgi:hypothetical protein